jgi:tetratricopeptide (TPR) repeat protein
MTSDARNGLLWLRAGGIAVVILLIGALGYIALRIERAHAEMLPHLDGQPSPLRDALRIPRKDFPAIPNIEREELKKLVPPGAPLRFSAIPAWATFPSDSSLGGAAARGNRAFLDAVAIMRRIDDARKHPEQTDTPLDESLRAARERLTAAQGAASPEMEWMIDYNRGVLYEWQNSRERAAFEFRRAFDKLKWRFEHNTSTDVRIAGIHALYGLGDALIRDTDGGDHPQIPDEAIDRLRDAVVEATSLFAMTNPQGVGHPAQFFEIGTSGLTTRILRNDLLAAYLNAPDYSRCHHEPMAPDVCTTHSYSGNCRYRDKKFCETKPSDRLRELYDRELEKFKRGETSEGTFWALQNVAEFEAENDLSDDPEVSYNVAYLLLDLKKPELANEIISTAVEHADQSKISDQVARLAFVTSILSGSKLAPSTPAKAAPTSQPGDYRYAYDAQYKNVTEPTPFSPLDLGDERKAKGLDAWLFIRRYRYLLSLGQFETFVDEHRRLNSMNVPHDFLNAWKSAVAVELLRSVPDARAKAQPETKLMIDRFLARRDLFTSAELKAAGLTRPWSWWILRWVFYCVAGVTALLLLAGYVWVCNAYKATFLSAYERDRHAREQLEGGA